MSEIGYGYGSEWHLLRYLGYHRHALDSAIRAKLGPASIEWLDFPFDAGKRFLDAEWKGMDFLPEDLSPVKDAWMKFWPQTGNVPNWDAVGWAHRDSSRELLLVEAKSYREEMRTTCGAKERGGLPQIREAFKAAKRDFGVDEGIDWLTPHYQYCNRLAALSFLLRAGVPARLVFIYFLGDTVPHGRCPKTEEEWAPALSKVKAATGLTGTASLEQQVIELFLPTCVASPKL